MHYVYYKALDGRSPASSPSSIEATITSHPSSTTNHLPVASHLNFWSEHLNARSIAYTSQTPT